MRNGRRAREEIPKAPTDTPLAQRAKTLEVGRNGWPLEAPWLRKVCELFPRSKTRALGWHMC